MIFSSTAQSNALWAGSVKGGCSGLKKYRSDFPSKFTVSSRTLKSVIPFALRNFAASLVPITKAMENPSIRILLKWQQWNCNRNNNHFEKSNGNFGCRTFNIACLHLKQKKSQHHHHFLRLKIYSLNIGDWSIYKERPNYVLITSSLFLKLLKILMSLTW